MSRTQQRHRLATNDNETLVTDRKQKRHRLAGNDNETPSSGNRSISASQRCPTTAEVEGLASAVLARPNTRDETRTDPAPTLVP